LTLPDDGEPTTVGILGAGAVGCFLGGLLASEGLAVRFVARGTRATDMLANGLTITTGDRTLRLAVEVSEDVATLGSADVVLLTVKSADTEAAVESLIPHLSKSATLLSVQNGVTNWERASGLLGPERVIAAVAMFGVELDEQSHVTNPLPGPLILGDPSGAAGDPLAATSEVIARGYDVQVVDDIKSAMWAKLVINTDMAALALTGLNYPVGLLDEDLHWLCLAVMEEALGVIRMAGCIKSASVVTNVMERKLGMLRLPQSELRSRVEAMNVRFTPSTLQSVMRGRTSETPFLNGEVARLADSIGQHAPLNAKLTQLMTGSHEVARFMRPTDLRAAVAGAA